MRAIISLGATSFVVLASGAFALALSGEALAQTTGTVNPSPAQAEPSTKGDVPPGGCMPIGLTASGEIVFPIQCKGIIERERGKAVEQKPAAVEEKPVAVEERAAAKQSVIKPVETVPAPKHAERKPRERRLPSAAGPPPPGKGSDP